jgi:hypothetical protein
MFDKKKKKDTRLNYLVFLSFYIMSCLNQPSIYDSIPTLESWYRINEQEPIQCSNSTSTSTKIKKCNQKTVSFCPDPIIYKEERASLLQYDDLDEIAPSSCCHLLNGILIFFFFLFLIVS